MFSINSLQLLSFIVIHFPPTLSISFASFLNKASQLISNDGFCIFSQSGALGSRLTGAGWGGCAVSLIPASQKEAFIQKMYDGFYAKDAHRKSVAEESLFATQPGGGATIYVA